ncbi:MAG: phosphopantetheine-binding protein [Geminicoccaceae bacterium]|nr:phosphopantetheine-binding protein [Geminicoccaceae bacterium]MDW8123866.1 phosphopantetheine-binding protein [Geminicoccaceae bacterium]
MSREELERVVVEILAGIAPEADFAALAGKEDLRDALDLDSMDFLNLVIGLHERLGIDIPEADYPKLFTKDGLLDYLAAKA